MKFELNDKKLDAIKADFELVFIQVLYLYSISVKGDYDFFSFIIMPKFLEEKVKI